MDNQECRYSDSLLRTSECLNKAKAAVWYAIQSIETGNPSGFHVEHLKRDLAEIDRLMK